MDKAGKSMPIINNQYFEPFLMQEQVYEESPCPDYSNAFFVGWPTFSGDTLSKNIEGKSPEFLTFYARQVV